MADKERIRGMLDALIEGNEEQAKTEFHGYFSEKTRETLNEAESKEFSDYKEWTKAAHEAAKNTNSEKNADVKFNERDGGDVIDALTKDDTKIGQWDSKKKSGTINK